MNTIKILLSMTLLLCSGVVGLNAQDSQPVKVGQRVRLQTASQSGWLDGTVVEIDSLKLALHSAGNQTLFRLEEIERLQVHTGSQRAGRKGAVLGFAIGAAVGFSAGYADLISCGEDCPELQAGATYGVLAGAVGALFGAFQKTDKWEEVSIWELRTAPR